MTDNLLRSVRDGQFKRLVFARRVFHKVSPTMCWWGGMADCNKLAKLEVLLTNLPTMKRAKSSNASRADLNHAFALPIGANH